MKSLLLLLLPLSLHAARFPEKTPDSPGARMLDGYMQQQTTDIEEKGGLKDIQTAEDWQAKAPEYRRQLAEMLGLDPMPERTALMPTKTGEVKGDGYVIENMHYQAVPGLYVTANLYLPEKVEKPLPTILYVCGHSNVMKDGVSLGNKTGYHHHGIWFARHGYVCLIIDTAQLGEIRGEHHGTFSKGRWWWFSRGYTPAGLEAWASIRGLDYLETRPEVDKTRFGVTGRSGGGAYSWWVAALDDRIKAAAPTAGVTNMRNHVVDGCIEGHCDCMFYVNTYRWDYDRLVALVAPRPLLICNTDKDTIFPIDGVFSIYQNVRRIYTLLGQEKNIGLQVAEGGHLDLQPLNNGAFHWFERHLKGANAMAVLDEGAKKSLEPEVLKVLKEIPQDQKNTAIDETFVPKATPPSPPIAKADWDKQRDAWMTALKDKVFVNWPKEAPALTMAKENSIERDGIRMTAYDFETDHAFRLRLYIAHRKGLRLEDLDLVALNVLDGQGWQDFCNTYESRFSKLIESFPVTEKDEKSFESEKKMFETFKWGMAYLCPRGIGPTEWTGSEKAQTQRQRRFYLVGQTLDSMRIWDIRRAVEGLKGIPGFEKTPLWLQAHRDMAANALYASLFEEGITRLDLHELPASHQQGPAYLNVLKFLDIPQAAAMAAEKTRVIIYTGDSTAWEYPTNTAKNLGWPEKQWSIRKPVQ
ncbi:acetyl xylan esterase AXE1 [Prosthecobacter fusiformis]|uniref:Acetyl xylan esterase AXE1 n=1 Tax=Prosthecobacter fusiformis TaxID=48464 RepID=A0A4R7S4C9_9BACT|nr:acetylxylan esterase [Prosthecobacter fusiformis]TDU73201.1 acetyl xylan esterase AXE1 [Prosthecobacter fusiformis]